MAADDRIVSHPDSISSFVLPHLLFQGILGMEPPAQNDTAQDQLSQTALDDKSVSNSSFHHLGPRIEEGEEEGKTLYYNISFVVTRSSFPCFPLS